MLFLLRNSRHLKIFLFLVIFSFCYCIYFYRESLEDESKKKPQRISKYEIYNEASGHLDKRRIYKIYKNRQEIESRGQFFIATILDSSKTHYLRVLRESLDQIITISAAILVNDLTEMQSIEEEFSQSNVRVSFLTQQEPVQSEDSWFPNNLLRNVARNLTTSCAHFLLIDVDLSISPGFEGRLGRG